MSINTNIYGIEEIWRNALYSPNVENKNKKAGFSYVNDSEQNVVGSYLRVGVWGNHLSFNTPIDKSLCFCGMDENAPLSSFYGITKKDGVYNYDNEKIIKRAVTNWCIAERISNAGAVDGLQEMFCKFVYNIDTKYMYWLNGNNFRANPNYNQEPYVKVVPKNQVLLIYVDAYNATFTNKITATLNEYITNYSTNYPKIVSVWARPYFGETNRSINAGHGNPNTWYSTPFIMILDKNNFNTENTEYDYCYSLFQTYGYNFFPILISDKRVSVYDGISLDSGEIGFTFGEKVQLYVHNNAYIPYINYSNDFKEKVLRATAYYGLFFTDRETVALNGTYTDNNMYFGVIDENGITHGDYTRGNLNATNPAYNYNDMQDSGYDYQKATDNTIYDNTTQFYLQLPSNAFTKSWVLTATDVSQLATELYTAVSQKDPEESVEEFNNRYFLCNNPLDCIVSLQKFPIQNILNIGLQQKIKLGAYETNVYANPLITQTYNYTFVFNTSNQNSVYPVNGQNFLDYEPYTKAELTVPFCGTVEIPLTYIYDYDDLTVNLIIDFISGACTAIITAHGIAIDSISGKCAIDLPVSGIQKATLENQMHNVAMAEKSQQTSLGMGLIGGAVAIGLGIATGNLIPAVGGATAIIGSFANAAKQGEQINYDLKHMEVPLKQISGASPAISQSMDMRAKLRITRPKIVKEYDSEVYAKTVGFACLNEGKVSDFSGLTIGIINFEDSGIEATNEEKEMIKNYFMNGVIL